MCSIKTQLTINAQRACELTIDWPLMLIYSFSSFQVTRGSGLQLNRMPRLVPVGVVQYVLPWSNMQCTHEHDPSLASVNISPIAVSVRYDALYPTKDDSWKLWTPVQFITFSILVANIWVGAMRWMDGCLMHCLVKRFSNMYSR